MLRTSSRLQLFAIAIVVLNGTAIHDMRGFPYQSGGELFFAAIFAQLSALCVWISFSTARFTTRCFVPAAAACVAAFVTTYVLGPKVLIDALAVFGCYVVLLMMALWTLERLEFFRRLTGATAPADWRFSLQRLLILIAVAAPLLTLIGKAAFLRSMLLPVLVLFVESIAITLIAILATTLPYRWVYRLALALGATFLTAFVASLVVDTIALPIGLIEAIVLFAWLELGQLVPRRPIGVTAPQSTTPTIVQPAES